MTTKIAILDAAQDLIQTRSLHGFSFQDIADRVGIRKPSLYHYFDSKDAIAVAVLERAAEWVRMHLAKADSDDPAARLERYFEMFRDIHGKGERMCPGGSFASLFDSVSSSVQSSLHRFTTLHLDLLENIVREGVERGKFQIKDQRPRDVALQIFAGAQGALIIGRLTGDTHAINAVREEFRSYLGYRLK
jgi:TetR/AcrR family transcriptional regulator, transcriptional repressor for nem operon